MKKENGFIDMFTIILLTTMAVAITVAYNVALPLEVGVGVLAQAEVSREENKKETVYEQAMQAMTATISQYYQDAYVAFDKETVDVGIDIAEYVYNDMQTEGVYQNSLPTNYKIADPTISGSYVYFTIIVDSIEVYNETFDGNTQNVTISE